MWNEFVWRLLVSVFLHPFFIASTRGCGTSSRSARLGEAQNPIFRRNPRIWEDFKTATFAPQRHFRPLYCEIARIVVDDPKLDKNLNIARLNIQMA